MHCTVEPKASIAVADTVSSSEHRLQTSCQTTKLVNCMPSMSQLSHVAREQRQCSFAHGLTGIIATVYP